MSGMNFIKGMGIGMAAGMAIGMAVMPRKKGGKSIAGRAMRAFGEVIDNISSVIAS